MMRGAAPPHRGNSAAVHESIMHRLMLSTQGGNMSSGSARMERSREDMPFAGRNFVPATYQPTQIASEMMDFWSNTSCADNFPTPLNGSAYNVGAAGYPNVLEMPPLPQMYLRCPECGICKKSSDEMEVHIKVEHLQWYPFQCTMCNAERAADFQLREHVHSAHRKNVDKFIYVDNPNAKRHLQSMMDRCLMNAHVMVAGSSQPAAPPPPPPPAPHFHAPTAALGNMRERLVNHASDLKLQDGRSSGNSSSPHETVAENPQRSVSALITGKDHVTRHQQQLPKSVPQTTTAPATAVGATATVISRKRPASDDNPILWNTNTDAVLSAIRVATHEKCEKEGVLEKNGAEEGDDDIASSAPGDRREVKSTFDAAMEEPTTEQTDEALLAAATAVDGNQDTSEILGNFAAIFSADDIALASARRRRNRIERRKISASSVAKKRVLGECGRCKRPVTAGARQMHMFYHLGKDSQVFRFGCKYPGCDVQHYRKDQMENHQSKVHGKIEPGWIEDRTAELTQDCQDLSMELLGTIGNSPGPTAERAQMAYDASMAAHAMNSKKKKRIAGRALQAAMVSARNIAAMSTSTGAMMNPEKNAATHRANGTEYRFRSIPSTSKAVSLSKQNDEPMIECRMCHQYFNVRLRGYHVLWHLSTDYGIIRYACKICSYTNDKMQTVINHGRELHGMEDCFEDRIEDYSDEVRVVSEKCFGSQSSSTQQSYEKSKPPNGAEGDEGMAGDSKTNISDEILSTAYSMDERDINMSSLSNATETSQEPPRPRSEPRHRFSSLSSYRDRMRKARNRRFGIRKPPSKLKRKEMAKLREISMLLGGAQYFKKSMNEEAQCEKCGAMTTSRVSDHAYKHLDVQLFLCPQCDIGNQSRDLVVKHIRDVHSSQEHPIDERWKYRVEIKEIMRECYPQYFIDAPLPTLADIEKLKKSLAKEKRFDARVLGTADGERPNSGDVQREEQEDVGEVDDSDSDDEQQGEDENDVEEEQLLDNESASGLDDSALCKADEEQQRYARENDVEHFENELANREAVEEEMEENDGPENEEFADEFPEQPANNRLLKDEDIVGNTRTSVKNEPNNFDLNESMPEEAGNARVAEEEEEEEM